MSEVIVGKWGKSLAVRVPLDVARTLGLADGERVEVEARDGDIMVRRSRAKALARADAHAAIEEIIAESRGRTLGDVTIRELLDEGRRG
jgi:antitoxin MazE